MKHRSGVEHGGIIRSLTDTELDLLIRTAGVELLDFVRTRMDPTSGLLALMEQASRPADSGPNDFRTQPGGVALAVRVWAAEVERAVIRGRGFAKALDAALAHALDVSRAGTLARNLARDLTFAVTRTRDLACMLDFALANDVDEALTHDVPLALAVARDLDLELSFARDRTLALESDLDLIQGLTPGFARGIARASHIARKLAHEQEQARELAALAGSMPVDVSNADLSGLDVDFTDVGVLAGMVWSETTRLPPGVVERLHACSEFVSHGVFRVRGGSERQDADSVRV